MTAETSSASKKLVLVGNPNVGKSVIFGLLTGAYALVSNFPGTTVEVSRGTMQLGGKAYEVIDTPGVNSLAPQSEDERVTCEILLREKPDIIIQVADAKNLRRTLLITSQLIEFGIPMILVLNMIDEAEDRGVEIDAKGLSAFFSIQVVKTIAIFSKGKKQLLNAIQNVAKPGISLTKLYPNEKIMETLDSLAAPQLLSIEWLAEKNSDLKQAAATSLGAQAFARLCKWQERYRAASHNSPARELAELRGRLLDRLTNEFKKKKPYLLNESGHFKRIWTSLLITGAFIFAWNEIGGILRIQTPFSFVLKNTAGKLDAFMNAHGLGGSFLYNVLLGKNAAGLFEYGLIPEAIHILLFIAPIIIPLGVLLSRSRRFAHEFGILTRRALTGIPILIGVLLLLYEFVGRTGAQTLVGLLEKVLFGAYCIPFLQSTLPPGFFHEFLIGKYGLISMGLTYALGIVLPVVGAFFIAFGLLEDSGYLPRLSILSDKLMRIMGLNGKAILPMVLGFGCVTMAVMSTRILNSKRERFIATLLLALGIPCSAQLGVIMGIAAGFSTKAAITAIGVVAFQLLLVGYISSILIKGRPSEFIFEIPPIRMPQFKNVALKTQHRVQWYLKEAVPLFLVGTLVLFLLDSVHASGRSLLSWIQSALEPIITGLLHLPAQAAGIFLMGFFRRDYGAAGLYDLVRNGLLNGQQTVVSLIVLTLFVPCLASLLVIVKEQGLKRALAIVAFITIFSLSVGTATSWVLRTFNIQFQ